MTDEIDDAMSEAAAARYEPKQKKPRSKYVPSDDDVVLKVRLDRKTFNELPKISESDDRGIEFTGSPRDKEFSQLRIEEMTLCSKLYSR
jgi:hypothetical protein